MSRPARVTGESGRGTRSCGPPGLASQGATRPAPDRRHPLFQRMHFSLHLVERQRHVGARERQFRLVGASATRRSRSAATGHHGCRRLSDPRRALLLPALRHALRKLPPAPGEPMWNPADSPRPLLIHQHVGDHQLRESRSPRRFLMTVVGQIKAWRSTAISTWAKDLGQGFLCAHYHGGECEGAGWK